MLFMLMLNCLILQEAVRHAFFDNNIIENYTYEQSVVDGVNVPTRVYRIVTEVTEHGGTLAEGTSVTETVRITNDSSGCTMEDTKEYEKNNLDRYISKTAA